MSIFAFNNKDDKPGKISLGAALGEHLGPLCSELFSHTASAFGGMQNIRANWIYDSVNEAWNLNVGNRDRDIYTVYGMADGFVCHFFFKNAAFAVANGFETWQKVFDAETLKKANDTITFSMK